MSSKTREELLVEALETTGLDVRYSHFTNPAEPPFLVYLGNGQNQDHAQDTIYWKLNQYRIEYYYKAKDPDMEETIESTLLANGFRYTKSEDIWLESEGIFLIYYYV